MRLPTFHELSAALVVARQVDVHGVSRVALRDSLLRTPTDGLFQLLELADGALFLERLGLLYQERQVLIPSAELVALRDAPPHQALELLLHLSILRFPPLWLESASGEFVSLDDAPTEEAECICRIVDDPERREAFLLTLAQRHDPDRLKEIGESAEIAVESHLRDDLSRAGHPALARKVRRVSLVSDRLGYDITTPTVGGNTLRIEVKASTAPCLTGIEVNISRNEFLVGSRDPAWRLVACRVRADTSVEVIGWCRAGVLEPHIPNDATERGRWSSASLRVLIEDLVVGLPPLT